MSELVGVFILGFGLGVVFMYLCPDLLKKEEVVPVPVKKVRKVAVKKKKVVKKKKPREKKHIKGYEW